MQGRGVVGHQPVVRFVPGPPEGAAPGVGLRQLADGNQVGDQQAVCAGPVEQERLNAGVKMPVAVVVDPVRHRQKQLEQLVVIVGAGGGVFQHAVILQLGQVTIQ